MKTSLRVSSVLLAGALCLGAGDPRESKFAESARIAPGAKVSYFDENGRQISFDAFFSQVMRGRSFDIDKDKASAQVRLAAVRRAPPAPRRNEGYLVKAGDAFPAFTLRTTSGARVNSAALRGKPTLVNFFFADCAPCIAEIPMMNAYAEKHPEVRVLAVTFDDMATAKGFEKQRKLRWPILAEGMPLVQAAGVQGFPTFALLGRDGRVLAIAPSAVIAGKDAKELSLSRLEAWTASRK